MKFKENLRKAGRKLADMDEAYAGKVEDFIGGKPQEKTPSRMEALRGLVSGVAGATHRNTGMDWEGKTPTKGEQRKAKAAQVGVIGAGYGIRYGLPAAGVTLAGKGILDLAAQFNQQTSGTIEIDYNSPAHGGNLSPASKQMYMKIHQGLMEDARRNTGYDEKVRAAYAAGEFDHDPMLKAHIADVMG